MNKSFPNRGGGALIVSSRPTKAGKIAACLASCRLFQTVAHCESGVAFLKHLVINSPDLVFIVAPLPDRVISHVIREAKQQCPTTRIIIVADWTELAGFARAQHKGADGFISSRLLSAELPLVMDRYPELVKNWGRQFSPWKAGYGMA